MRHKFLQGECKLIATAPVEYETKVHAISEEEREKGCCWDINLMETRLCDAPGGE
jgi:hypothetical protein